MQDIDKFGFNLVNLAEKENYPWSSPEAAIESELQMSPEEFIQNSLELFSEFEAGTEGVIGDAWTWFTNLIRRFWNWITGNNKKEKAKIEKVEEKIKTLNKEYKNPPIQEDTTKSYKEAMIKNKKEFNKAMTDPSTRLEIDDSGIKAKHVYWAPLSFRSILGVTDNLTEHSIDMSLMNIAINLVINDINNGNSVDDIVKAANSKQMLNFMKGIKKSTKEISSLTPRLAIQAYDTITEAASTNAQYYNKLKKIKEESSNLEKNMNKLNIALKNTKIKASGSSNTKSGDSVFIKCLTKYYPEYKKEINGFITRLDTLYAESIKRNRISAKANGLGIESEEFDNIISYGFGFVTPSITSGYAYEGLEEEYHSIKKLLSECDAEANEYFDDYVFFGGTEGFVDTIKLYGHKIWDAIRRFFMWIASKFSDKYKEKYELEKLRATFNSLVTDYADYVKYDDYHKGVQDLKNMANDLRNSLNSSEESVNIFRLTSGLESEDYTLTVTNYEDMNNSIEEIAEEAKDLAKFTKYFIDMVATGKANSKDFRALITKDLQDLPGKLNKIKFPGTKVITPKDAKEFKEEVNTAINYCKEFKTIIDYMNKHKAKVDKFFENPELKDNTLAKEMIAAMNRYFVPSVKSISNIIDWYIRCINTDIKKLKNVTK